MGQTNVKGGWRFKILIDITFVPVCNDTTPEVFVWANDECITAKRARSR